MFAATMFFLGLAICIFGGLICFWMAKFSKSAKTADQTPNETAAWNQIKTALIGLYSQYENKETSRQKVLRSWAGTLVICAGICMIGVLLEVEYNQRISMDTIISGFVPQPRISAQSMMHMHHNKPMKTNTMPSKNNTNNNRPMPSRTTQQ
jgi:hypothetical protein